MTTCARRAAASARLATPVEWPSVLVDFRSTKSAIARSAASSWRGRQPRLSSRLAVERQVPRGGDAKIEEQAVCLGDEALDQARIICATGALAHHRPRGIDSAEPVRHDGVGCERNEARGEGQLFALQPARHAAAVPALEDLEQCLAHVRPQVETIRKQLADFAMRDSRAIQAWHVGHRRHKHARADNGRLRRPEVTQQRRKHARRSSEIGLREVPPGDQFVAERLRGDVRVRVAADESEEGHVVHD